jgi:hypothetical protein
MTMKLEEILQYFFIDADICPLFLRHTLVVLGLRLVGQRLFRVRQHDVVLYGQKKHDLEPGCLRERSLLNGFLQLIALSAFPDFAAECPLAVLLQIDKEHVIFRERAICIADTEQFLFAVSPGHHKSLAASGHRERSDQQNGQQRDARRPLSAILHIFYPSFP